MRRKISGTRLFRTSQVLAIWSAACLPSCAGEGFLNPDLATDAHGRQPEIAYAAGQSKANAKLENFGRSHPECLAWTDWSRTCSRLNADGQTLHCNAAVSQTKRSVPFCLAAKGREDPQVTPINARSAAVFNRFCTEFREVNGKSVCFSRDPERPFSGYMIAEVRHPFCEIWGNSDGPYCSEKPDGTDLPSCGSMEGAPRLAKPLSCFKQNSAAKLREGCSAIMPAILENYPVLASEGVILPTVKRQSQTPTANIYCFEWEGR